MFIKLSFQTNPVIWKSIKDLLAYEVMNDLLQQSVNNLWFLSISYFLTFWLDDLETFKKAERGWFLKENTIMLKFAFSP